MYRDDYAKNGEEIKVAEGVVFTDGVTVVRWTVGEQHSTVVWDSIEDAAIIHGSQGNARFEFHDL